MLTAGERRQILTSWNHTEVAFPAERCIHSLFELQAARTPEAVAVCQEGRSLTYEQLERQATQLARRLRGRGVGPESPVALCIERSPEMLVGVLGIFKAGGTYVPMDPSLPRQRGAFMLEETGARWLLTQRALRDEIPAGRAEAITLDEEAWQLPHEEDAVALPRPDPQQCAIIIYTSGSTGVPKGVQITHEAAVNHLCWRQSEFPLTPADAFLQKASCGFDISLWEMFAPLVAGGRLVLARPGGQRDNDYLAALVAREQVTVIHFGPIPLAAFLEAKGLGRCQSLRYVFCGGEPLTPELCDRFFSRLSARLIHQYGPTETCIDSTVWPCERRPDVGSIPIGRPIANTQAYVLDAHLQPVPTGVAGELYLGGAGLARGYFRRPSLTAKGFIPNPFSIIGGERLYRTGDRARWLASGSLELLGRIDHQVKLRGYRIELGEIESTLLRHPGVREAVVTVHEASPGDKRLVAYLAPAEHGEIDAGLLRAHLQGTLPDYMVPSSFVFLPSLPLSRHGKVDRKALPPPDGAGHPREYLPPRDPFELVVVNVFEETLQASHPVSVCDSFFELGGHSLLAVRVVAQIEERTGHSLPLDALVQAPTPEQLARLLRQEPFAWSPLVPIQPGGSRAPFFCVHPVGGNVLCYVELARCLGPDQPFYGLQAQGLGGQLSPLESIEEMAALYVETIRAVEPHGPYRLGGWSLGAVIAFEMARLLHGMGEAVELVALIEPSPTSHAQGAVNEDPAAITALFAMDMARLLEIPLPAPPSLPAHDPDALLALLYQECNKAGFLVPEAGEPHLRALLRVFSSNLRALWRHTLSPLSGALHLLRGTSSLAAPSTDPARGWGSFAALGVKVLDVPGDHYSVLQAPNVEALARELALLLEPAVQGRQRRETAP
jgi:amino acid adenylation domain-containing protein